MKTNEQKYCLTYFHGSLINIFEISETNKAIDLPGAVVLKIPLNVSKMSQIFNLKTTVKSENKSVLQSPRSLTHNSLSWHYN